MTKAIQGAKPIMQATQIVYRMEENRRMLQASREAVRQSIATRDRLKKELEGNESYHATLVSQVDRNEAAFLKIMGEYERSGTGWLKIEAVPTEDDIKKAEKLSDAACLEKSSLV